ncbi:hypothetical protein CFK38_16765 [Brachybacterium vulturis]|uniref:Sugar ABC transporter substrate-binding protein n=1 Tax=Brachybacterium vulturis TaxID=2017484 RepID=A0A291GRW7_9MICO|nr:extracellular solute-binding protein [Brachybacterium vulturis]ATG52985.1 hypothetical protein CFK38_16765 [Brachybacterium vulturis]
MEQRRSPGQDHSITPTRRQALGLAGVSLTAAGLLSSCGSAGGRSGSSSPTELTTPTTVEAEAVDGLITSEVEGVAPLYVGSPGAYRDVVSEKPAAGGSLSSFQILWGAPVTGHDENQVWQKLEDELGVDSYDITMVPAASYGDKLATLLASGQLPDFVYIQPNDPNAARALSDGAFLELNDYLEGDKVEQYPNLATTPAGAWTDSALHGALLGVPNPDPLRNNLLVLRLDAMKEVGVDAVPEDAEDLKSLWLELAKLGKVAGREVFAHGALEPTTFEPLHDLGQEYQIVDGKVTHKYLLPQYEDHLAFMAELWKGGFFHPDALGQVNPELFKQGQQLNYEASFAGFYWVPDAGRINLCKEAVPTAEFIHYAMPSVDGGVGKHALGKSFGGMVCIPADRGKDEDRVRELLRICDYYRSPFGSQEALFLNSGIEGRQFDFDADKNLVPADNPPTEGACTWLGLLQNRVNQLPEMNKDMLENIKETLESATSSGSTSAVDSLTSSVHTRNASKLDQVHKDYYNAIVSGRRPVSDAAELQQTWLDRGGQDVLDDFQKLLDEAS